MNKSSDSEFLQEIFYKLPDIVDYYEKHLSDNALVIESKEQWKFVVPKNNHLHKSQDKEEEHQDYEVFPYNDSQGNVLKVIHKSLTISLQLYEETCSPHPVHPSPLESEGLFIYVMLMHRKWVRLLPNLSLIHI